MHLLITWTWVSSLMITRCQMWVAWDCHSLTPLLPDGSNYTACEKDRVWLYSKDVLRLCLSSEEAHNPLSVTRNSFSAFSLRRSPKQWSRRKGLLRKSLTFPLATSTMDVPDVKTPLLNSFRLIKMARVQPGELFTWWWQSCSRCYTSPPVPGVTCWRALN